MTDTLELLETEGKIAALLEIALLHGPEAESAKARLTVLGHALVDQGQADVLGEIVDRIVALDPARAEERFAVLDEAWGSVAGEG